MVLAVPGHPGRLRHAVHLDLRIGGAESNVAIALARLGIASGWMSWVGDDELGDIVLSRIRAEGVDTSQVRRIPEAPTGFYLREQFGKQVRAYYYRRGSAASLMAPEAFDPSYLDGARIFHITGITPALSDSCRQFTRWVIRQAKDRHLLVSYDVNYRSRLWSPEEAKAFLTEILPTVDLLFFSQEEGLVLWKTVDEHLLRDLSAAGPRDVIVMAGGEGCFGLVEGQPVRQTAFQVPVVDPVGAGDAFVAGYLAGCVWGLPTVERLKVAVALGAFSVMAPGDYEGLPTREELWAFIHQAPVLGR